MDRDNIPVINWNYLPELPAEDTVVGIKIKHKLDIEIGVAFYDDAISSFLLPVQDEEGSFRCCDVTKDAVSWTVLNGYDEIKKFRDTFGITTVTNNKSVCRPDCKDGCHACKNFYRGEDAKMVLDYLIFGFNYYEACAKKNSTCDPGNCENCRCQNCAVNVYPFPYGEGDSDVDKEGHCAECEYFDACEGCSCNDFEDFAEICDTCDVRDNCKCYLRALKKCADDYKGNDIHEVEICGVELTPKKIVGGILAAGAIAGLIGFGIVKTVVKAVKKR